MNHYRLFWIIILLSICLFAFPTNAAVILTLDAPVYFGTPGTAVKVTGTLFNPDLDTVFLNTASGTLSSVDLDFDFTDYYALVPRTLGSGQSYAGPIVSVLVNSSAISGGYSGSLTVQGGIDANAFDDLATQNFQLTVAGGPVSGVPEPATGYLLMSGVIGAAIFGRILKRLP